MAAPLPYLLITVKEVDMQKLLVSDMQNLKHFPETRSADGKYSLLNWDNLTQHIQIQLSQKPKTSSQFFCEILKSSLDLEHFQKKDDSDRSDISEITESEKHG